jgi:putative tryptophan/tyrosine transport system substrate-binding protein
MDRRTFVWRTVSLLAAPLTVEAQSLAKVPRIGVLVISAASPAPEVFRRGLQELGYTEGRTIAIDVRSAEGRPDRLPSLAAELVRLEADVIVTSGELGIRAARQATRTTPIVMAVVGDPVATGFATSLARPGGNITGLSNLASGLEPKRLQLLKEAIPRIARVAVLRNPGNRLSRIYWDEAVGTAKALGVTLRPVDAADTRKLVSAFELMQKERADALSMQPDSFFFSERARIAGLAVKNRLPSMHDAREFVDAGGLMSYGPSVTDLWRRAATYVDKILKGARPADLPIEQPTKFELVINLKTAKALGLTIPPAVLARADEVIE